MEEKINIDIKFCLTNHIGNSGLSINEIKEKYNVHRKKIKNLIKNIEEIKFLDFSFLENEAKKIWDFSQRKAKKYNDFVLVGIGGSSLGTETIFHALKPAFYNLLSKKERNRYPRFFILDNPDPDYLNSLLDTIDIKNTFFNFVSKSGKTLETISNFLVLMEKIIKKFPGKSYSKNISITSCPSDGVLLKIAKKEKISLFEIPKWIPGRFSVLSSASLLPASFIGINPYEIINGARYIFPSLISENMNENLSLLSAIILILFYEKNKFIHVIMPYSNSLFYLADWYSQLWAESLGKEKNTKGDIINWGQTPLKAKGPQDQHSLLQLFIEGPKDKIFTFLEIEKFKTDFRLPDTFTEEYSEIDYLQNKFLSEIIKNEKIGTEISLKENLVPSFSIRIPCVTPFYLGQLFILFELQTIYAAEILEVNPFDQPAVELGKKITQKLLTK
ncbi:MAG: glucose-6-phosphate isomerase [Acidobacteriota bacterium]